jgi:hypothetical protein
MASDTASSNVSKVATPTIGPNVSVRYSASSASTPPTIVGWA